MSNTTEVSHDVRVWSVICTGCNAELPLKDVSTDGDGDLLIDVDGYECTCRKNEGSDDA